MSAGAYIMCSGAFAMPVFFSAAATNPAERIRREASAHPLTWLSHRADVSLFGLDPAGHHATSLVLHVLDTLLLFVVFRDLTGDRLRSFWVAALFAVHPAHVESVAWVAERKDVLSTAFWLGTMWAYGRWVRQRTAGR